MNAVQVIRLRLNLSQTEFAHRFGISLRTLQNWEQGRRQPDTPAIILLHLIHTHPTLVAREVSLLKKQAKV